MGQPKRLIATIQCDDRTLEFVNSVDAKRLAEPEQAVPIISSNEIKPLLADWKPSDGEEAIESPFELFFRGRARTVCQGLRRLLRALQKRHSPALRQASPDDHTDSGLGIAGWGKSKSESRVTTEFYNCR